METVRLCNVKERKRCGGSFRDHGQGSTCFKVKKTYLYLQTLVMEKLGVLIHVQVNVRLSKQWTGKDSKVVEKTEYKREGFKEVPA